MSRGTSEGSGTVLVPRSPASRPQPGTCTSCPPFTVWHGRWMPPTRHCPGTRQRPPGASVSPSVEEESTLFLKGALLPSSECSGHAVRPVQTGANVFIRNSVFISNYSLLVLFPYLGVGSGGAGHRRASQTPGQAEGGQVFGRGRIDRLPSNPALWRPAPPTSREHPRQM